MNKLGSYITKLMTTVLDNEQEQFVRDLALSEFDKAKETEKQLLQEDKDVKDK